MVTINGNPWFVAKDVLITLGYSVGASGVAKYLGYLGSDEKAVIQKTIENYGDLAPLFVGTTSRLMVLSESGLYKLAMRSGASNSKPFQDWVTKVVLPAIRKDGAYIM